jgi:HEAT repeat protein
MAIPARLCHWLPAAAVAALALASCRSGGDHWWSVRRSPQQEMLRALEAEDPDVRRQALTRVVESDQVTSDWAFDGLDAVARTDPDSQVRCTAIAGLRRCGRPEAVETLLQILHADRHPDRVAPPDAIVRCEAVNALSRLCAAGRADEQCRSAACETLISLLTGDADRHVRLSAADGLSAFRDPRVLPVLVGSLRDRDFGVAFAARKSLVALTGMEFGYDPPAWQQWLDQTAEPFTNAPPPKKPQHRPWWKLW